MSSRGTKRSRLFRAGKQRKERLLCRLASICHREERSDLAFHVLANRQKRDCRASLAMTRCVIARDEAISVVRDGGQRKERLPRYARNDKMCHREGRSDLAFSELANSKKRDCRASLAMTRCVIARNKAISPFTCWQTEKREIAALRSQ